MAGIDGSGTIIDEPGNKIDFVVEPLQERKIQFVLRSAQNITWWKSLDLFVNLNGQFAHSKRIETKDSRHEAQIDFFEDEMTDAFKVEFWKAGPFNFGKYVTALTLESYDNLNKRLIFTVLRD
jgi:hypothetical protein